MVKNIKYVFLILFLFILLFRRTYKYSDIVNIAMSLNNNYTYPIMVSITSILSNLNKNTFIHFHLLIGNDFEIENQNKIKSLKNINNNSNFSFYNVGNNFNGWIHRRKSCVSFYRIIIGELIKNVDKIIYLDGDTLIYGDISEMYQLNMDNLYFRGVREILPENYQPKIDGSRFICAGVMLMNLKLIREEHFFDTFKKYYFNFFDQILYLDDQHIINALFKDKINFLPPKFGIWFMCEKSIKEYKSLKPLIYTRNSLRNANKRPIIRHLWGEIEEGLYLEEKPWELKQACNIKKEWQFYAKKTGYYTSICKYFENACLN